MKGITLTWLAMSLVYEWKVTLYNCVSMEDMKPVKSARPFQDFVDSLVNISWDPGKQKNAANQKLNINK